MRVHARPKANLAVTVISNDLLSDRSLSAPALGVLIYILKSPGQPVAVANLQRRFHLARDAVRRILRDLQAGGYVRAEILSRSIEPSENSWRREFERELRASDPQAAWWFERLSEATPTLRDDGWKRQVPAQALFQDYLRAIGSEGRNRRSGQVSFGMKMRKLVPGLALAKRKEGERDGGDGSGKSRRVNHYVLPDLSACRRHFEAHAQQPISWLDSAHESI